MYVDYYDFLHQILVYALLEFARPKFFSSFATADTTENMNSFNMELPQLEVVLTQPCDYCDMMMWGMPRSLQCTSFALNLKRERLCLFHIKRSGTVIKFQ